jgi:hypothetical protein
MKITAEPRSDQWNADDFVQGPRTVTIAGVKPGSAEQKYDIVLEGSDRVWRPPLTVLRILLAAWGDEASQWVGRRATLYRDASIRFGPSEVGGIRVSHLSDINEPLKVALSDKRGSRKTHTIQPLKARDWLKELEMAGKDRDAIRSLGVAARTAGAAQQDMDALTKAYIDLAPTSVDQ